MTDTLTEIKDIGWEVSKDFPTLLHADDVLVYATGGFLGDQCESLAARAVSCLNACKGMADPVAEIARLRAALARLVELVDQNSEGLRSGAPTAQEWREAFAEADLALAGEA